MSVIDSDKYGSILDIRPQPDGGATDNAWGSSLYMQPFLPGAVLRNTNIRPLLIDSDGIIIESTGKVSKGESETFGDWFFSMKFSYINSERVEGSGAYAISLDAPLNTINKDLNIFRIASNYLSDVPLRSGGIGDTGDMQKADVFFNDADFL